MYVRFIMLYEGRIESVADVYSIGINGFIDAAIIFLQQITLLN